MCAFCVCVIIKNLITVIINNTTDSISDSVWRCPKNYYWCNSYHHSSYYGCQNINNYICDRGEQCEYGKDEKYCDQTVSLFIGNIIFIYIL